MNNHLLPVRVLATSAFKSVLIALLASSAISTYAQGNLQKRASRSDITRNHAMAPTDPEAIYEGARVVHNVTVNGEKGMRVHATFRVKDGLDVPCMLIAYYFYDDEDSTPLKTDEPKYRTKSGSVYSHADFTPAYDPAVYKDLQLFMPYAALNMESGEKYDLKFYLALYDKSGQRFFGKSGWYKFKLTMP
jgi:hypothetical protein